MGGWFTTNVEVGCLLLAVLTVIVRSEEIILWAGQLSIQLACLCSALHFLLQSLPDQATVAALFWYSLAFIAMNNNLIKYLRLIVVCYHYVRC